MSRVSTWGSTRRVGSFASQAEASKPKMVVEQYSTYFISWPKLKAWLDRNFPRDPRKPYEKKVLNSNYHFELPRSLTDQERNEIRREHDINPNQTSTRAVSPGG